MIKEAQGAEKEYKPPGAAVLQDQAKTIRGSIETDGESGV
jgi:hypothetical protein